MVGLGDAQAGCACTSWSTIVSRMMSQSAVAVLDRTDDPGDVELNAELARNRTPELDLEAGRLRAARERQRVRMRARVITPRD